MLTPAQRAYRFLRGDGSLTIAVLILVFYVFLLQPMVELGVVRAIWLNLSFALIVGLGALLAFEPRLVMWLFLFFLAGTVSVRFIDEFHPGPITDTANVLLSMVAALLLGILFLVKVLRDGRMNLHRIMGAVGSFLLIGLMFAQAYRLLAILAPGAFAVGGAPATVATILPRLSYFSFITLTSLGYGDITPLHPYARSLTSLEALAGQLFLAILIARLVAMEIDWRHDQREARLRDRQAKADPPPQ